MKNSERAWQVWPLLTFAAVHRQLLTYDILARHTGMHAAGFGPILEHIQSYCLEHGLPPLTVIVVNKASGRPGEGFVAASDLPQAFLNVFDYDWNSTSCPLPDALTKARERRPSNGVL